MTVNSRLQYTAILDDALDMIRDITSGHLDTSMRMRAANRILDIIAGEFDGEYTVKRAVISYLNGESDYHLDNNLGITDFKSFKDLRLQDNHDTLVDYMASDKFAQRLGSSNKTFSCALETRAGNKIFRIIYDNGSDTVIVLPASNTTENGATWAATDDGASLAEATDITKVYGSCLKFNIDVSASANNYATLTLSDFTDVDLSDYEDIGKIRMWVYIPSSPTSISSLTLRFGNDNSNYWQIASVAVNCLGQAFETGWNRIEFDWADATEVGTPAATTVDWLQVVVNHSLTADLNGLRINQIKCFNPIYMEFLYYSDFIAKNSSGTVISEISAENDEILLPTNFKSTVIAGMAWQFFGMIKSWTDNETLVWQTEFKRELNKLKMAYGHNNSQPKNKLMLRE